MADKPRNTDNCTAPKLSSREAQTAWHLLSQEFSWPSRLYSAAERKLPRQSDYWSIEPELTARHDSASTPAGVRTTSFRPTIQPR